MHRESLISILREKNRDSYFSDNRAALSNPVTSLNVIIKTRMKIHIRDAALTMSGYLIFMQFTLGNLSKKKCVTVPSVSKYSHLVLKKGVARNDKCNRLLNEFKHNFHFNLYLSVP